jgi:group II intron reverse transcriptase/maturase
MEMETKLQKIGERSRKDNRSKFKWLMPLFTKDNLAQCFHELNGRKAVGIDKRTKEDYGEELSTNLDDLIDRMKRFNYRPQPVKEVLIPKDDKGGTRPLGIANIEDKIVQQLFAKILGAIYEPTFMESSYGFRPGRNCHQAVKGVASYLYNTYNPVILDVDLTNFFGTIDHQKLIAVLSLRIEDQTFLRYIVRMLKAGILNKEGLNVSDEGTAQGSICSPILANIFAHYAIDLWIENTVKVHCPSVALFRYCDDFVLCFTNLSEAEKVNRVLLKRLNRFSLAVNQSKTKMVCFDKRQHSLGKKQESFDFLGFTFYLGNSSKGVVIPKVKTSRKKFRMKLKNVKKWCKQERSTPGKLAIKWAKLNRKLQGHCQYYGVSHNARSVRRFIHESRRIFFKWMNRRSQKPSFTWEKFLKFEKSHPCIVYNRVIHHLY